MSNVVNWKKISVAAAALFFAEVLVGFFETGAEIVDLDTATRVLALSTLGSLSFSILIFFVMAARQRYRPFLHASVTLLLAFALSCVVGAILPDWPVEAPLNLLVLEWLTLGVGMVIGTFAGRYVGLRIGRQPQVRADA